MLRWRFYPFPYLITAAGGAGDGIEVWAFSDLRITAIPATTKTAPLPIADAPMAVLSFSLLDYGRGRGWGWHRGLGFLRFAHHSDPRYHQDSPPPHRRCSDGGFILFPT